jgi:hypothetical protein
MKKAVLIAVAALALTSLAAADEIFFSGFTNGGFNSTPSGSSAYQTASLLGLAYGNSTFSGTSASGFLSIGANGQPVPGSQNLNNLGSFTLSSDPNSYAGNSFTLLVTFSDPNGITGGNTSLFTAALTGTVSNSQSGGVFIDFNNTPIVFTFSDTNCSETTIAGQQTTCGNGSFNFFVNDLSIFSGETAPLTGTITGAQQSTVPEPGTLLLMGSGISALAGFVRRRRK